MTGDDHRGEGQQQVPADVQGGGVRAERIVGRAGGGPPRVGAGEHAVWRGRHRGNVLGGVPGGAQQPDRGRELRAVGVLVDPPVPRVHGPVIMNAHRGEQRCVDRVIGVLTVTSFGVSWKAKTSSIWKPYSVQLTGQVIVAGGAR